MKIKICGVTHPDDAEYAARLGATHIGMIFANRSKRKVVLEAAKNIARISLKAGAIPVGVFEDQSVEEISSICSQTGLTTVQLHGSLCQGTLSILLTTYSVICAISVQKNGTILSTATLPPSVTHLYDNSMGGMGTTFDWNNFSPPPNTQWILAGGLNSKNVAEAIIKLKPHGVDVATGVEFVNSYRKDPVLLKAFIHAVKKNQEVI